MLEELDGSLRNFLRADVPLRADDIDIEFATPDKEWSARLSRSTVNLFLFDVRRSTTRAVTGRTVRNDDGGYYEVFRTPLIRARYLITVWTAEAADEHRVLGDVLRLLAVASEVPSAHLVGDLAELDEPGGARARRRRRDAGERHVEPARRRPTGQPRARRHAAGAASGRARRADPAAGDRRHRARAAGPDEGPSARLASASGAGRGTAGRHGKGRSMIRTGTGRCASISSPP